MDALKFAGNLAGSSPGLIAKPSSDYIAWNKNLPPSYAPWSPTNFLLSYAPEYPGHKMPSLSPHIDEDQSIVPPPPAPPATTHLGEAMQGIPSNPPLMIDSGNMADDYYNFPHFDYRKNCTVQPSDLDHSNDTSSHGPDLDVTGTISYKNSSLTNAQFHNHGPVNFARKINATQNIQQSPQPNIYGNAQVSRSKRVREGDEDLVQSPRCRQKIDEGGM
jgi:hypothetical protein